MTELVLIGVAAMFFLVYLASTLSDNYDPLKMFLISLSLVLGALNFHLAKEIAVGQSASSGVQGALDIGYWMWITLTTLTIMYFALYLIIRAYNAIADKKKIRLYDEENS